LGKLRFINVAYIRSDKDSPEDDQSWLTLLRTLKIETPLVGNKEYRGVNLVVDEEKLNGRAISLPKPEYPAFARQSRAGGTVLVRVIVDEKGNVAEIVSVSGHPALVEAAAKAARKAKFTPTAIAGQPVRVTGLITYNFVSR
jgi:TonB family protein